MIVNVSELNDYRLLAVVRYENGVMMIRFFGSHGMSRADLVLSWERLVE
jgi:mRNA-degrading endonuclease HigB of HigAB toxin-antitoxin module